MNIDDWIAKNPIPSPELIERMVTDIAVCTLVDQIRREQTSRSEIIDVLLATRGLSEGVTADAILAAMRSGK